MPFCRLMAIRITEDPIVILIFMESFAAMWGIAIVLPMWRVAEALLRGWIWSIIAMNLHLHSGKSIFSFGNQLADILIRKAIRRIKVVRFDQPANPSENALNFRFMCHKTKDLNCLTALDSKKLPHNYSVESC